MTDVDVIATQRRTARWSARWSAGAHGWLAFSAVAIAVVAVGPFVTASLPEVAQAGNEVAANYAARAAWAPVAFYVHVFLGGVALLLAPAQFSAALRRRAPRMHRVIGGTVLAAIVGAGSAGAVLAPFSLAGDVGTAGFGALAVLWVGSAVATGAAIRRGDVAAHRRWAVRTFALTYAAVTLRLELMVLIPLHLGVGDGDAFHRAYLIIPFLSWVPNLVVAEYLVRRARRRPARVRPNRLVH
jgi:uncharacterized membrane protein